MWKEFRKSVQYEVNVPVSTIDNEEEMPLRTETHAGNITPECFARFG
jgi:hypothetical protein